MRAALDELAGADPRLAFIEQEAGPLPWRTRPQGFASLLHIVVGQVISSQAAAAIWARLSALPGATDPAGLLALPDGALRQAGLSGFKAAHARSLAQACVDGTLDVPGLAGLPDHAAMKAITAVRGLGPWTAEVYLLFALQRPDVFPAGDVAVAGAAARVLGLASRPDPRTLRRLAEPWAPYRALAARLLWHDWRHKTGRPIVDELAPPGNPAAIIGHHPRNPPMLLTRRATIGTALAMPALALPTLRRAHAEVNEIAIAKQFGTLYLQQDVMEQQRLIEKHGARLGLPGLRAQYVRLGGTGPVTEALLSGSLHFASGGAPGALLLWDRTRGAIKSAFAMNATNQRLLTVGTATQVQDIGPDERIALPAVRTAPQAVYLQMAAAQAWGAAEFARLDSQTISRAHPDSMAQMLARTEVTCHFSSTPFQDRALAQPGVREITSSYAILGVERSTPNTIYAQSRFRAENPIAWRAALAAFDEATNWINQYPADAAALYLQSSGDKDTAANVLKTMQVPGNVFTLQPAQVQRVANFMADTGTLKRRPADLADLFFPEAVERGGS